MVSSGWRGPWVQGARRRQIIDTSAAVVRVLSGTRGWVVPSSARDRLAGCTLLALAGPEKGVTLIARLAGRVRALAVTLGRGVNPIVPLTGRMRVFAGVFAFVAASAPALLPPVRAVADGHENTVGAWVGACEEFTQGNGMTSRKGQRCNDILTGIWYVMSSNCVMIQRRKDFFNFAKSQIDATDVDAQGQFQFMATMFDDFSSPHLTSDWPDGVRSGAGVQAFVNWARDNPAQWGEYHTWGIKTALAETFPCSGPPPE